MTADDDDAKARLSERIAAVRARFVQGLGEKTDELSRLALKAGDPDDPEALSARDALRLGLHNLAGGAPTLGLQALGRKAAEIEARLVGSPKGRLSADVASGISAEVKTLATIQG